MGIERQKKKNRSSVTKSRPKVNNRTKSGRRKVNFLGNETIAQNWDRKLTLTQNYQRLGLSSKLDAATGGGEKVVKENQQPKRIDSLAIPSSRTATRLVPEQVSVERDPETGRILKVVRPQDEKAKFKQLDDPLNDITEADLPEPARTDVVAQLEREAAQEEELMAKRRPRQQSQREEEWIARLVEKHGDNVRAMVRDRKLNPMQQTEGDIGRRVRKWQQRNQVAV